MDFGIDLSALFYIFIFAAIGWLFWKWRTRFEEPRLYYSSLDDFSLENLRVKLAALPNILRVAALAFFVIAFIDPHYYAKREKQDHGLTPERKAPTEGIAIYLVLDQSGSMSQEVMINRKNQVKIDLLKQVTKDFIVGNSKSQLKGRSNDLIGLIGFSRGAQVLAPLTLDHEDILNQLNHLHVVKDPKQDATAIGYAIYKTVDLIAATRHYAEELAGLGKPAYEIKNAIILLVTDGLQSPSPLDAGKRLRNIDLSEAGEFAKENHVKIYIVNVDPRIGGKDFAPQRHLMERVTAMTGGKFYMVNDTLGLPEIYSQIDKIEKSLIPVESLPKYELPNLYMRVSLYGFFIVFGIVSLFIAILLDSYFLRRVP
jgi:Ca-activated chloride channel family protein